MGPIYSPHVDLHVSLDRRMNLTVQIYQQIRAAVLDGRLRRRCCYTYRNNERAQDGQEAPPRYEWTFTGWPREPE